jgi:hypothetical protein
MRYYSTLILPVVIFALPKLLRSRSVEWCYIWSRIEQPNPGAKRKCSLPSHQQQYSNIVAVIARRFLRDDDNWGRYWLSFWNQRSRATPHKKLQLEVKQHYHLHQTHDSTVNNRFAIIFKPYPLHYQAALCSTRPPPSQSPPLPRTIFLAFQVEPGTLGS